MTYLEQACHRHALALWRQRARLSTCRVRIISKILWFSEMSSRPTASASILIFNNVAAAGAAVYRSRAPQISNWAGSLASRQGLAKALRDIAAVARQEIRVHQESIARLADWTAVRAR